MAPGAISADQLYEAAMHAFSRGAFSDAETHVSQILGEHPTHFFALILHGQILERLGHNSRAIAAYDRAAALNPGHALPFTRRTVLSFRAAFGEPLPPRLGDPNRPAVSMTSLGCNGRFGNQLLQYAFIRIYAQERGLIVEVPDWIGRDLFDLDDPLPGRRRPSVNETQTDVWGALNNPASNILSDCDLVGYFGGATRRWGQRSEQFRALFRPGRKVSPLLDRAMQAIRREGKTLVAVHLRRGDFGYGKFWIAPTHWYLKWLEEIWGDLDVPVLYVASDDPQAAFEFAKYAPLSGKMLGVDIPGVEFYLDHYVLSRAQRVAISNSSFSFTAAMLNDKAVAFLRPDPNLRCLVTFDPWDADSAINPRRNTLVMALAQSYRAGRSLWRRCSRSKH